MGLTVVRYCSITESIVRPRFLTSRRILRQSRNAASVQLHPAAIRLERAREYADGGALARAVVPENGHERAARDLEREVAERGMLLAGVGKGQTFDAIELHVRASFLCSSTGVRQSRKYASSTLAEYGVSTPRAVG